MSQQFIHKIKTAINLKSLSYVSTLKYSEIYLKSVVKM